MRQCDHVTSQNKETLNKIQITSQTETQNHVYSHSPFLVTHPSLNRCALLAAGADLLHV